MDELRLAGLDTRTLKEILDSINEVAVTLDYMPCRAIQEDIAEIAKRFAAGGWISVDDALPEPYTQVIVTWVNHSPASYYMQFKDIPFVSTAVWYNGSWFWWNDRIEALLEEYGERGGEPVDGAIEITHWMPLPKPPEVEE